MYIGLTGGIASGKSTVTNYLVKKKYPVIDSDKIAHSILLPEGPAYGLILQTFGKSVLDQNKAIDRKILGQIVFENKQKLILLNQITHPLIRKITELKKLKFITEGKKIIFNDIPLLFENNLENKFDKTLVIYCPRKTQIERMAMRDKLLIQDIEKRLSYQLDIEQKKINADYVIDNSSDLEDLYKNIDSFLEKLNDFVGSKQGSNNN